MRSLSSKLDDNERFREWESIRAAYRGRPLREGLLRTIFGFFPEDVLHLTTTMIKKFQLGRFQLIVTLEPKKAKLQAIASEDAQ